jgi:ABC-type antimicrobial peptide transport system permease subunit
MLRWVIRQLIYEPYRTLLTAVAMAGALAVILLLEGFMAGLLVQMDGIAMRRGADLIVTQTGVRNFVGSRSLLPQLARQKVEDIEGVKAAHPITMLPVIYKKEGYRRAPVFFVVYDTGGGPYKVIEGKLSREPRQIVIDESLAVIYDLKLGDKFVVSDFEFQVSGIAEQASALFTAFAFIYYDDMLDFFFDSDLVGDISNLPLLSFLLVELEEGADREAISTQIEQVEKDADVFTPEQIAANDVELGRTLFSPVMNVLIAGGYIIALLVVGMIMFSAVRARLRAFGVIKALGFRNMDLVKGMVLESLLMILLSFPLAILFAGIVSLVIEIRIPLYLVPVADAPTLLRTFSGALLLAVIGGCLPYRSIARLDPAIAFRN